MGNNPISNSDILGDTSVPGGHMISAGGSSFINTEGYKKEMTTFLKSQQKVRAMGDPVIQTTLSVTKGSYALQGEIIGIGLDVHRKINETDVVGWRDNTSVVNGKTAEGQKSFRTGEGMTLLGFGADYEVDNSNGKIPVKGGTLAITRSVPGISTVEKSEIGTENRSNATQASLVSFKAALYFGVEASLNINIPRADAISPERKHLVSESTQVRLYVPQLAIPKK